RRPRGRRRRRRSARPGRSRPASTGRRGGAHGPMRTGGRRPRRPPVERSRSGVENLVEKGFRLVLIGLLGESELADEDLAGLGEHALLARGQTTLAVPPPQV